MRVPGIGGRVMQKLGASVQLIPPGEIYLALERGVIDATELAVPSIDLKSGFHQVAKNYYFPGWHQPATVSELIVNKAKWDALDEADRTLIKMACRDTIVWTMARGEATQPAALEEIKKHGVKIHQWPPEFLAAFRKASDDVFAEMSAESADFARVYTSLQNFRDGLGEWMTLSAPVRERFFDVAWESGEWNGRPVVRGSLLNRYGDYAIRVQLLVEGLDATARLWPRAWRG